MGGPVKIFGWQADMAGCAWYRLVLPLGALRQQGHDAAWGRKLEEEHWEADVVIAQRTCLPGPTGHLQRMSKHKGKRPLLVMELDDDLLHIDKGNKTAEGFYGNAEIKTNLVANMRAVDLITVSTEPLAEQVRKYNPNVVVLPNCIPRGLLAWQPGCFTDRFTVGWQGSATHDRDWQPAADPVRRWFNQAKTAGLGVEMHTIGPTPASFPQIYPHRTSGWRESMDDYYRLMDWHVALAPLAPSVFNDSKSDIRVLEAAALGFPVVASAVTAYQDQVLHSETGFLVYRPTEWGKYLRILAADPELRLGMSQAARDHAASRVVEDSAHLWVQTYQQQLSGRRLVGA